MLILPDKPINQNQLNNELAAINLPGFTGTARLSREIDEQGNAVLENGVVKKVPPYILVKSDDLSAAQITAATTVVSDHIPSLDPQRAEKEREFVSEGVTRIAAQVPDWDTIEAIKVAAGMWAAISATATPAQIAAKDIYLFVRDTVPAKLAALTTKAEIDAVDQALADPFGDGTPWPA